MSVSAPALKIRMTNACLLSCSWSYRCRLPLFFLSSNFQKSFFMLSVLEAGKRARMLLNWTAEGRSRDTETESPEGKCMSALLLDDDASLSFSLSLPHVPLIFYLLLDIFSQAFFFPLFSTHQTDKKRRLWLTRLVPRALSHVRPSLQTFDWNTLFNILFSCSITFSEQV